MNLVEVKLSIEQQEFVRRAVASGRFPSPEGAVQEALALWVERERRREEILAAIDQAEASLARGEGRVITRESMRELAEQVHQRRMARLAEKVRSSRRRPGPTAENGHRLSPV